MATTENVRKRGQTSSPRTKRVQFLYEAPNAAEVAVAGTFCGWKVDAYPLKRGGGGRWKRAVALPPGRYEYRFVVDGEWREDPACNDKVDNPYGGHNSVVEVR
ncbi:MAG: glycogen-binding domain-containing protein [Vicinamibacteria bacterium]